MTSPGEPPNVVQVNRGLAVTQSVEPAVAIDAKQYDRLMDRLEHCKPSGWSDVWLAVAGIAGGVAGAASVGLLTLPDLTGAATSDVLRVLAGAGALIAVICVIAYFTQRQRHGEEIEELKKDMEMHRGVRA